MIQTVREFNFLLGFPVCFLLCYRSPEAIKNVASKRLYVVLILFPIAVAFGSVQAYIQHAPGGPITFAFSALYIALAFVLVWWPRQLTTKQY